ncbi:MAG: polysaccharide deacetylase family protein [Bacillota bacterium]|nr:polysaccharide deacetylase family protein [Bacillota bacterium]MDD3297828.1 polysaccharide deacetylase family protein [Bacillota bacterium]MDD4706951.1 polysaccharide deacetylase family protein [Bacillota bacterium]
MRILLIRKSYIKQILLVVLLVAVSVVYTQGYTPGVVSVLFNNDRRLPIYSVETDEKKIAISFDAAYGDQYTPQILDILDQYNVNTTFFLVGFWIDKYGEVLEEIHRRGHEIGNHSTTHPQMSKLTAQEIKKELETTGEKIKAVTGKDPILFRPPFGDYNNKVIDIAQQLGYYSIQWDVDSLDWKEFGVEPVVDRVLKRVNNGSIVLFHNNAKYVSDFLPIILDRLIKEGYTIVPVSQLIIKDNYFIDHTGRQRSID